MFIYYIKKNSSSPESPLKPSQDNSAPSLSLIKIVKYCGDWGGGGIWGGRQNPTHDNGVPSLPLRWLCIVALEEGGGALGDWGRQNQTNDNGAPSLSVIKIDKYCDV